jgi:hypothetical protein
MLHLAEAEAEQERWYQNTVRGNERDAEEYGSLATDYESEEEESDDEEEYEEEEDMRPHYNAPTIAIHEVEDEDEEGYDDYEEDYEDDDEDGMFALTRTTSHRPPSLCSDESDDDDDEHPPSPLQPAEHFPISQKDDLHEVSYFDGSFLHEPSEVIFGDRLLPTMVSSY